MKKGDYEYMMYNLFSQLINLGPISKTCDSVNNYPSNTPPPKKKPKTQKQLIDDTQNIIAN